MAKTMLIHTLWPSSLPFLVTCLKGEGEWRMRPRHFSIQEGKPLPAPKFIWGLSCCSLAMDLSKSCPLSPHPLPLELVGQQCCVRPWSKPWLKDGKPEPPPCAAQSICCSTWTCLKFLSKPSLQSWLLKAPFFTPELWRAPLSQLLEWWVITQLPSQKNYFQWAPCESSDFLVYWNCVGLSGLVITESLWLLQQNSPKEICHSWAGGERGSDGLWRMTTHFWLWRAPEEENQNMGSDSAKQLSICFKSKPCLIPLTPMGFNTELNSGLKIPPTFFFPSGLWWRKVVTVHASRSTGVMNCDAHPV